MALITPYSDLDISYSHAKARSIEITETTKDNCFAALWLYIRTDGELKFPDNLSVKECMIAYDIINYGECNIKPNKRTLKFLDTFMNWRAKNK